MNKNIQMNNFYQKYKTVVNAVESLPTSFEEKNSFMMFVIAAEDEYLSLEEIILPFS